MYQVADWGQRKREIGMALRQSAHLPHESDPELYAALLEQIGIGTRQDLSILISVVNDAIMTARREERPTTPLDTFLDWLKDERDR